MSGRAIGKETQKTTQPSNTARSTISGSLPFSKKNNQRPPHTLLDYDVVFPSGNEAEFISMAKKLGWKKLCFVYENELPKSVAAKRVSDHTQPADIKPIDSDIEIKICILRKGQLRGKPEVPVFYQGLAREVIEQGQCDVVFDLEVDDKPDFVHHRRSGLNQVICDLMREKKVTVGFSFATLLHASGLKRARYWGRMQQNARLARKFGLDVLIGSFARKPIEMRNPRLIEAMTRELGL